MKGRFRPGVEGLEERALLAAPVIDPITTTIVVPTGKTRILPITGSDADGNAITYSYQSSDPNITIERHTANTYLQLDVQYQLPGDTSPRTGVLLLQLMNDLAPQTVGTITNLVNQGFYNGLTFHRIAYSDSARTQPFVIQGGDPNGDGTGGPGFSFNDEFNAEALFSGDGQLAMANSGPDTNGSQFFITSGTQRSLDFGYSLFGQLVRGFDVRDNIFKVAVTGEKPTIDVTITKASIVKDKADDVITLHSTGAVSSATITVTATDGTNQATPMAFTVQTKDDSSLSPAVNDQPFLGPVPSPVTTSGNPVTFKLTSTDLEGDPVTYQVLKQPAGVNVQVNGDQVTVTPPKFFVGNIALTVGVHQTSCSNSSHVDSQAMTVVVKSAIDQALPADQRLIVHTYREVLGREPDSSGLASYMAAMQNGLSGEQMVRSIENSPEGRTHAVANLYQQVLNRSATPAEIQPWVNYLNHGGLILKVRAAMMGSDEYFQTRGGGTTFGLVQAWYSDALGRSPDTNAQSALLTALGQNANRPILAYSILNSAEGGQAMVGNLYQSVLARGADAGGLAAYTALVTTHGWQEADVMASLLASQEIRAEI